MDGLTHLKEALRGMFSQRTCPVMVRHRKRLAEIMGKIPGGSWREL